METKSEQHEIPFINAPPPDWILFPSLFAMGIVAFLVLFRKSENKIGRARLATKEEVENSRKVAIDRLKKGDGVTLWINSPKVYKRNGDKIIFIPDRETIMFTDASRHIAACATTGGGKTKSVLNPLANSAVWQDIPIIALDYKGDKESFDNGTIAPTSEIAGFALSQGYEIFTIDPYGKDSYQLNLVNLGKDGNDASTFRVIASALTTNSMEMGEKKNIWDNAGAQIIQWAMMMARSLDQYQDLATVQKLLARLHQSPQSIRHAKITQYQQAAIDQFLGAVDSPETAASVIFTAMRVLGNLIIPEITNTFCRATTIPIILKPKQMLIFRVNPEHQTALVPIYAAALEVILSRNLYSGRNRGGLFLWDEAPQMRLPSAAKDMGVARDKNWVYALGLQGMGIMELEHGKEATKAIFENVNTLWIGKQASTDDAKKDSERFGKEDVNTKSKNSKGGTNTSPTQRDLITPQEFLGFRPGEGVIESPGISAEISDGKKKRVRVSVPYLSQIKISKREEKIIKVSTRKWLNYRKEVAKRIKSNPLAEEELLARQAFVLKLLPDPAGQKNTVKPLDPKQLWESIDAIQQEVTQF
jgi:type IV secretory pathway TraG/TraD family ATPase VirD4